MKREIKALMALRVILVLQVLREKKVKWVLLAPKVILD